MGSEKPNFLSQPVVKNVFMFRNGDPYYEARRIVINEKRVSNFETLLREVTGGIQAPFGAVRNIYTPRGGHKVDCMESLQGGEQYVAAGKEKFKKLDYLDIGTRKKRMMQTLPAQARPLPQNRIIVSARFLKPIKEPCTIFVVANGDVLNPAMRLLIHQRMMDQFERILEMITEKMGLRILGGVRSLYTYEGHQVADGSKLECGQLYVAVGRERFKKLPYSDLLFTRPKGTRRIRGMKAHSLPPIYRFSKQSGNSKSTGRSSDSGDRDSKASPPNHCGNSKEDLASTVREISQARLLTLRKKKSGQSITADSPDNDDREPQDDSEDTESKTSQDQRAEEKSDASDGQSASKEDSENTEEEPCSENATETDGPKDDKEQIQDTDVAKEEEEKMESDEQNDEKEEGGTDMNEQKVEEVKEVKEESKNEVNIEDQASTSSPVDDKPQDNKELKEDLTTSSEAKKEQDDDTEEDKQERAGNREESSNGHSNDADTGEARKQTENGSMPGETQSDNEKKGSGATGSSSRTSNQEEDVIKSKDEAPIESGEEEKINGEVETQVEPETKNSVSCEDATAAREQEDDAAKDNQDN